MTGGPTCCRNGTTNMDIHTKHLKQKKGESVKM